MKKKWNVAFTVVLSALIAGCVFWLGMKSRAAAEPDSISCTARLVTIRGDTRADVMVNFDVNPRLLTGVAAVSGEVSNGNVRELLYRRTMFTYTRYKTYYRFTAQKIVPVSTDERISDPSLLAILPGFFIQEGASVDWKVTQEGKQGYLFSVGKMPRFFCEL